MVAGRIGSWRSSSQQNINHSAGVRNAGSQKSEIRGQKWKVVSGAFYRRTAVGRTFSWSHQSPQGCREIAGGRSNVVQRAGRILDGWTGGNRKCRDQRYQKREMVWPCNAQAGG